MSTSEFRLADSLVDGCWPEWLTPLSLITCCPASVFFPLVVSPIPEQNWAPLLPLCCSHSYTREWPVNEVQPGVLPADRHVINTDWTDEFCKIRPHPHCPAVNTAPPSWVVRAASPSSSWHFSFLSLPHQRPRRLQQLRTPQRRRSYLAFWNCHSVLKKWSTIPVWTSWGSLSFHREAESKQNEQLDLNESSSPTWINGIWVAQLKRSCHCRLVKTAIRVSASSQRHIARQQLHK